MVPQTDSEFQDVRDSSKYGTETLFWGKHTYSDRRQIVFLYRIDDRPIYSDIDGPALLVERTYYLDYKSKHGLRSEGDTFSITETHELTGVYDPKVLCWSHFEDVRIEAIHDMRELERDHKLFPENENERVK